MDEKKCPAGHDWKRREDQHGCKIRSCLKCSKDGRMLVVAVDCKENRK